MAGENTFLSFFYFSDMKHSILTTIALSLFVSSAVSANETSVDLNNIYQNLEAKTEAAKIKYEAVEQDKGTIDPKSFRTQKERMTQLNYAISMRQQNDFSKQYLTSAITKNAINQKLQHQESRYQSNVPESSTQLDRTGDLEFVPFYQYRRPFSNPSTLRTNRKQVSRQRAIDYYINQGYAGTEALQENLVRGDEYEVERVSTPIAKAATGRAAAVQSIRAQQRSQMGSPDQVATGNQRTSRRINSFGRTYSNPYQFPFFVE